MRGSRSRQTDFAKKARSYGRSKSKNTPKAQPQASPTYGNNRVKTPKPKIVLPTKAKLKSMAANDAAMLSSSQALSKRMAAEQTALASQDPKLLLEKGLTPTRRNLGPVTQYNERGRTPTKSATAITPALEQGRIPLGSTKESTKARHLSLLAGYQEPIERANFNQASYDQEAAVGKDSLIRGDKYRNDEVSYNQAYWKAKRDGETSQADMAAEQKAIGSKKSYSGDRVITEADQGRAKYILSSLGRSGITPTVTSKTSGLFDEMNTTTSSYDIGTGKPMTTTRQQYSPIAKTKWGNLRLGDDVTKTFVNGVAVYTQKNDDPATTSETGSLNQRSQSSPDPIKEMADIDNQIKTETDPAKLKALHKRRLMLMRMNRTNTRFAGLLGEADTKRTNLMSIS